MNWRLLKALRERRIKQRQFAGMVGDSEALVSRIINGLRPSIERESRYASALGMDRKDLFGEEDARG